MDSIEVDNSTFFEVIYFNKRDWLKVAIDASFNTDKVVTVAMFNTQKVATKFQKSHSLTASVDVQSKIH